MEAISSNYSKSSERACQRRGFHGIRALSYHWPAMTNTGPFYLIQPIHYHVHTAKTGRFAHFEAESPELPISRISWEYRNSTGHDRWGRIDVAVGAGISLESSFARCLSFLL